MATAIPSFGGGYDDYEDFEPGSTDVRCKICGIDGLSWIHTGARWRLADSKGLHKCPSAPADAFEVEKPDDT